MKIRVSDQYAAQRLMYLSAEAGRFLWTVKSDGDVRLSGRACSRSIRRVIYELCEF
jgi:hypothetical protein